MTVNIGDIVTMKKFRWNIGVDRNWLEFTHPDKSMAFAFMFMGSEPLDGSAPTPYTAIMAGLGWGDVEKLEKKIIDSMRAEFEVTDDGLTGSATVDVKRVEIEDDGSYKVVLDYWPKDVIYLDHLTSHGEQIVKDTIRSSYDRGYNDARNAKTVPGDSALGYRGRDESARISEETLGRLRHLSELNRNDDTLTDPKVRYLLEDCASYIDTLHAKHKTDPLEIGIDTDRVRQAASALNRPDDALWRFWNDKARDLSEKVAKAKAALEKIADQSTVVEIYNWNRGPHLQAIAKEALSALNRPTKATAQ